MSEIQYCTVTIALPSPRNPSGIVANGAFIAKDNIVTMVDRDGRPVEDSDGRPYTQELAPGEDAETIARRLTKKIKLALRGPDGGPPDFNGPIRYPYRGKF